ncbi:MAG TPA: hypothetical protein VJ983_08975 [candidate division Zixibacteria bacterium]|nr:hypothetical protein [candidate division Zixibacteria bacterium]
MTESQILVKADSHVVELGGNRFLLLKTSSLALYEIDSLIRDILFLEFPRAGDAIEKGGVAHPLGGFLIRYC